MRISRNTRMRYQSTNRNRYTCTPKVKPKSMKMFDILSEVKLAYVKLQEAHIPYDPEKIRAADEMVLSNLDGLCKVRRAFKEKQFQKSNSLSACLTVLRGEIKVQERLLEKLKTQAKKKGVEISYLKGELCDLDEKNRMLVEEIKRRKGEEIKRLNLSSVDNVINEVAKGIHDFAKPLIALMKASGWDLDEAANAILTNYRTREITISAETIYAASLLQ